MNMGEEKEVTICRVCLNYDFDFPTKGLSLFEEYNGCVISDKVNAITNVGIKASDGLPDRICPTCLEELENAYSFKSKCEKSNEILLSAVYNDPIKVEYFDTSVSKKEEDLIDDNCEIADPGNEIRSGMLDTVNIINEEQNDNAGIAFPNNENAVTDENCKLYVKEEKDQETKVDIAQPTDEYQNDFGDDYEDTVDKNIIESDLEDASNDIEPEVEFRPSKAIDLKLECHDCGETFKSKCKLRVHWKKIHIPEQTKCPICLQKFKSYKTLNLHKKKKLSSCRNASKARIEGEGKNRIFHCRECDFKTNRNCLLMSHLILHTGEQQFQCERCPSTFKKKTHLTTHMEREHNVYHHGGTCQFCGKLILGQYKYKSHVRRHKQSKQFPCNLCNSVLKSKDSLKDHLKRHSGIKAYACEACGKSFYTSSEYYNHRRKVHLKIKKVYKCDLCNYTSTDGGRMVRHKAKHTATNVSCDVCGFFVDNEEQLIYHKKRHTDKSHECCECKKMFFSRKNLNTHEHNIHGIIKAGCGKNTPKKKTKRK